MDAIKSATSNHTFGPPESWNNERNGECTPLHVTKTADDGGNAIMQSEWKPNQDELDALNAGAPVVLTVWGVMHPPVAVNVGMPTRVSG